MILIAAVITVGLIAFGFSQYQAAAYQKQYTQTINSNIQELKEKIVFEYVVYDGQFTESFCPQLGAINNVTIKVSKSIMTTASSAILVTD